VATVYLGFKSIIFFIFIYKYINNLSFFKLSQVYGEQARYFEMERFPKIKHRKLGAISMANNGQDMHGSQVYLFIFIIIN
jgi:cyclophilin family peptidyl-prolyl cis-trans isomerase